MPDSSLLAAVSCANHEPVVVCVGGGTNSTALLVGLHERGERVDLSLFADTGAEKPETYRHVAELSAWCVSVGFPPIITVQSQDRYGRPYTLEEKCLAGKSLPSIAYGFKSCSEKHKKRPQDRFLRDWVPAQAAWAAGGKVTKLIGYDAGEERRAKLYDDGRYRYRYPLLEWDWDRDDCIAAIRRANLGLPGKSSCFFCPSMKKHEIVGLAEQHPDLMRRALTLEANAELTSIKGLGRRFAWRDLVIDGVPLDRVFCDAGKETDCGCYDGEE